MAERAWLIFSGLISLLVAFTLFFVLIVVLFYTPPIVRPPALTQSVAVDLIVESYEATPPATEHAPVPARREAGVRELFGEVNATYTPDKRGQDRREVAAPRARIEIEGNIGHTSRLPPEALELEATQPAASRRSVGNQESAGSDGQSLQNRYLAEIHQQLSAAWRPGHGDLGKMAMIEMRISAQGLVRYKIVQVRGDEPFKRRLQSVLEGITRLEPPPRSLLLNVNFIVKE